MKQKGLILLIGLFLSACGEEPNQEEVKTESENVEELSAEEFLRRHITSNLNIPATEKFDLKIYKEKINGDDVQDYVVTVNRLDFALNEAIESGNVAKRAEVGYMGTYNYVAFMNGATRAISSIIPVPSSPHAQLRVRFEKIRSEAYYDILVDFRIRNSGWTRFFTVIRDQPMQTFEMKNYDGLGTEKREAYIVSYEKGSYSLAKDILVYKAELEDIELSDPMEIYTIDPEITSTTILDRRWFFHDQAGKYYTEK